MHTNESLGEEAREARHTWTIYLDKKVLSRAFAVHNPLDEALWG